MKKRMVSSGVVLAVLIAMFLIIFPQTEILTENELIAFRYSDDISEFESELSVNENYMYYDKLDISIHNVDIQKFFIFYVIRMEYIEGNYCETEFLLKEEYIADFLQRAEIQYNSHNVDVAELIAGKMVIVGNTRYFTEEEKMVIEYTMDDNYGIMYLFESDGLLVIQVGESDEGPKFIAYK